MFLSSLFASLDHDVLAALVVLPLWRLRRDFAVDENTMGDLTEDIEHFSIPGTSAKC